MAQVPPYPVYQAPDVRVVGIDQRRRAPSRAPARRPHLACSGWVLLSVFICACVQPRSLATARSTMWPTSSESGPRGPVRSMAPPHLAQGACLPSPVSQYARTRFQSPPLSRGSPVGFLAMPTPRQAESPGHLPRTGALQGMRLPCCVTACTRQSRCASCRRSGLGVASRLLDAHAVISRLVMATTATSTASYSVRPMSSLPLVVSFPLLTH